MRSNCCSSHSLSYQVAIIYLTLDNCHDSRVRSISMEYLYIYFHDENPFLFEIRVQLTIAATTTITNFVIKIQIINLNWDTYWYAGDKFKWNYIIKRSQFHIFIEKLMNWKCLKNSRAFHWISAIEFVVRHLFILPLYVSLFLFLSFYLSLDFLQLICRMNDQPRQRFKMKSRSMDIFRFTWIMCAILHLIQCIPVLCSVPFTFFI